jgi:hypothetical protein
VPRHSFLVWILPLVLSAVKLLGAEVRFQFADGKNDAIGDVVVSLVPLDAPPVVTRPSPPVILAQQNQEFLPYVLAVQVGTAIEFPNRDTVKHHVYSSSKAKKFELPLYAGDAQQSVVFDHAGVVTLGCNIHDWMLCYVVVLETPWYAKSETGGTATIAGVPPGRYRAEIWQPRLAAVVKRELVVSESASSNATAITLELKRDRRIRRTLDATSGPYK